MMRILILLSLIFLWSMAETLSINTPFRGKLYDEAKLFMEELFKRNGYELEYQKLPHKRALINANRGIEDGDGPRVKAVARQYSNLRRVDVPIMQMVLHAYYRDKDIRIRTWEDLKPYHVAVRRGIVMQVDNVKRVNPKEITYISSSEKLFELLKQKKVDIIIAESLKIMGGTGDSSLNDIYQSPALVKQNMYLFLHKKHNDKLEGFESVLLQMKEEGYQKRLEHFYKTGNSTW